MGNAISLSDPLVRNYAFYSSLLVMKMLIMSPLTSRQRLKRDIFVNKEDVIFFWRGQSTPKIRFDDDNVERVRRAHLNDLENIPVFLFISALYTLTNPVLSTAALLMKTYTIARFVHTAVYAICVIPQPARALSWTVGYGITFYMAYKVANFFM